MPLLESPERLNVSMVKNQSRQLVFKHIFRHAPVTRAVIAAETGLSQGTVKTIVDEFLAAGIVEERKDVSAPVGRKPQKVYLNARARTFGVLHLQPGRATLHCLDLSLEQVAPPEHVAFETGGPPAEPLRTFLLDSRNRLGPAPSGIGIVVPGAYDPATDRVICRIMPELQRMPLRETVRAASSGPVTVGEDVHLAALAEAGFPFNAAQPLFYLYAGNGVGGSYVADGRVLPGANRMAGEIGQVTLGESARLEDLIRWPAFLAACGIGVSLETAPTIAAGRHVAEVHRLLEHNDRRALDALETVAAHLARALEFVVCILNPRTILVGGPYAELGEALLGPVRALVMPRLMAEHRDGLQILPAQCGESAMIRGAGSAVLEKWLETAFTIGGDE